MKSLILMSTLLALDPSIYGERQPRKPEGNHHKADKATKARRKRSRVKTGRGKK